MVLEVILLNDLDLRSEWQKPSFLFIPRKDWPISTRTKEFEEIDADEKKESLKQEPSPKELEGAKYLTLLCVMPSIKEMMDKGQLVALMPKIFQDIIVTTGRIGELIIIETHSKAAKQ